MIEITLLEYLKSKLNVPIVLEEIQEKEYVLIERTGSGIDNHIKNTTFAIQSYSDSLYNAAFLNEEVKEAMEHFAELDEISRCELNTDYNYTDTSTKHYRYQAIFDIVNY